MAVFNGTFLPELSLFRNGQWNSFSYPGWSIANNGTYGGIATQDHYVYVTDNATAQGGEPKGIVRFDLNDVSQTARFFTANEYIDITLGLDNKLYALRNMYGDLDIIDAASMSIINSVDLGHTSSSRAVTADSQGNIYMASWNGSLYKYDANGVVLSSILLSNDLYDIDINIDNQLVVSDRSGMVFLTDTDFSPIVSFSVGSSGSFVAFSSRNQTTPSLEYCQSSGSNTHYEWIEAISIDNTVKISGDNNGYYQDNVSLIPLSKSQQHNVLLQPGFAYNNFREHWKVWVDYNQDGLFGHGEEVVSQSSRRDISSLITLPADAIESETTMRIAMKYGSSPGSCENFYYGEVEDYRVLITP